MQPMKDLLGRLNITGFDSSSYIDRAAQNVSALPNIALTFSGGGWRAMLNGAGAMAAFDDRTRGSTNTGNIGGLLQASTYTVGVSGGNWLVGSLHVNNFTSVQAIMDTNKDQSGSLWNFDKSIIEGPDTSSLQLLSTANYYTSLYNDVNDKHDAGYNTSITDYWGRGLSYYLVNASDGGPAYTWSSIANDDGFKNGNTPMPISVSDGRSPDETFIFSVNATNFESNPFEFGSWDPTVYGFAPMKYVGSRFSGGQLFENESCVAGFDNAGFIMGTSSSLFNTLILNLNGTSAPSILKNALAGILNALGEDKNDISDWINPFYYWNNGSNPGARSRRLTLVDGGEDLQNIGFDPIVRSQRNVDIIFSIDSSADDPNTFWPNGTSMVATYERFNQGDDTIANGTRFPAVPDVNTFVNLGLNTRPTFFGCNDSAEINAQTPLVVYIPNHPYVYYSNVSTFDMTYNMSERNAIITNGYDVATMGNGTLDSTWPTCVGCAVLHRSLLRTGTDIPDVCQQCLRDFCWNGTVNSDTPPPFNPTYALANQAINVQSAGIALSASAWTAVVVAAASGFAMAML